MKAIVLAGGLGTRLREVVGDLPKPMARVGSRPFLEYVLDYLRGEGVEEVVLAVSYRWQVIRDHFRHAYRGVRLRYSVEEEPLGTGGAIRQALEGIGGREVVVVNGDTLFRVDLGRMAESHRRTGAKLTIAVKRVEESGRFGRVEVSEGGEIVGFLEKSATGPGWINGGVYMVDGALFRDVTMPRRFSFEEDYVAVYLGRLRPRAFFSDASFIDMGIPEDYARAIREIGREGSGE